MRFDHSKYSHGEPAGLRALRRVRTLIAVAAVLTTALAALPAPRHAEAADAFTIDGGGFGHSVGMSQFGAYGMSREGASWQDIMTHYFTGATPGDAHPSQVEDPLWVNLTMEQTSIRLTVFSTGGSTTRKVVVRLGGASVKAAVGETIVVERTGSGCRATTPEGSLNGACSIDLDWDGFNDSPKVGVELQGCSLVNWNAPGGSQVQPCRYARGAARIRPDNNTATMNLSLEIDIEDYILGISEMPYGWGDTGGMAALQAQAVAARSYALHRAVLRGDAQDRPWCWCHLYDTTLDQHYVGWGHGTQNWVDAVTSTTGKVMFHPSESYGGNPLPIETFYSSSTFGWTENSEDGFISYVPYLRSVDDHWSQLAEVGNHSARWTRTFSGSQLASLLPGMSTVTGVEITECSDTGAALELTFYGSGGPRAFETRTLRGTLSLKSMQIISINGTSPCSGPGAPTGGGPAALAGITLDDDSDGDSLGDGDGVVECGETIEMWTSIATEGATISGVTMEIASPDPYVSVVWNTTSPAGDVSPGAAVANDGDWDLAIASNAPHAHRALLDLTVRAGNGGPWALQVPLDIACGSGGGGGGAGGGNAPTGDDALAIPDVNGNGSADHATVVTSSRGRSKLVITDGRTGRVISRTGLAGPRWQADDAASALTPEGDLHIAVPLAHRTKQRSRLVLIDASSGDRIANRRFRGTSIDLEFTSGGDQIAHTLGVGSHWKIRLFSGVTGAAQGRLARYTVPVVDTEPTAAGLAVLTAPADAAPKVEVLATDGSVTRTDTFGTPGAAVDLEAADGGRLTVLRTMGDRLYVDSHSETGASTVRRIAIDALLDSDAMDDRSVAVLVDVRGRARVFVVDTATGNLTERFVVSSSAPPVAIDSYREGAAERFVILTSGADGPELSITDVRGSLVGTTRLR